MPAKKNTAGLISRRAFNYAKVYGAKAALDKFQEKYPRYPFLRTSINNWKRKITSGYKPQKKEV